MHGVFQGSYLIADRQRGFNSELTLMLVNFNAALLPASALVAGSGQSATGQERDYALPHSYPTADHDLNLEFNTMLVSLLPASALDAGSSQPAAGQKHDHARRVLGQPLNISLS
jgi:hypothetical protein